LDDFTFGLSGGDSNPPLGVLGFGELAAKIGTDADPMDIYGF
jgi:hypothetical protein